MLLQEVVALFAIYHTIYWIDYDLQHDTEYKSELGQ